MSQVKMESLIKEVAELKALIQDIHHAIFDSVKPINNDELKQRFKAEILTKGVRRKHR